MALSQLQKRKHSVLSLAKIKTKFSKNFSFAVKFGIFGKSNSVILNRNCYECFWNLPGLQYPHVFLQFSIKYSCSQYSSAYFAQPIFCGSKSWQSPPAFGASTNKWQDYFRVYMKIRYPKEIMKMERHFSALQCWLQK